MWVVMHGNNVLSKNYSKKEDRCGGGNDGRKEYTKIKVRGSQYKYMKLYEDSYKLR